MDYIFIFSLWACFCVLLVNIMMLYRNNLIYKFFLKRINYIYNVNLKRINENRNDLIQYSTLPKYTNLFYNHLIKWKYEDFFTNNEEDEDKNVSIH